MRAETGRSKPISVRESEKRVARTLVTEVDIPFFANAYCRKRADRAPPTRGKGTLPPVRVSIALRLDLLSAWCQRGTGGLRKEVALDDSKVPPGPSVSRISPKTGQETRARPVRVAARCAARPRT